MKAQWIIEDSLLLLFNLLEGKRVNIPHCIVLVKTVLLYSGIFLGVQFLRIGNLLTFRGSNFADACNCASKCNAQT